MRRFRIALAFGAALTSPGMVPSTLAQTQVPFSIVVAQTPWYPAFEHMVSAYESQTGNKVNLDVNPTPALMDKVRNSVRSSRGEFDLLTMNATTLPEYYFGGYVADLRSIDTNFKLSDGLIDYAGTALWDPASKTIGRGDPYSVPINGNIQLLYYRTDLYKANGLSVPKTWNELYANAKVLNKGGVYGMAIRGNRSFADSSYDFYPYLVSHGAGLYKPTGAPDTYQVTVNSREALAGLDMWTALARPDVSAPNPATISQVKLIELLATGKAAQAGMVAAAWPQLDDPDKSLAAGKIAVAPLPAGPAGAFTPLGHWTAGISVNVPPERQRAALAFLTWFQTAEAQADYVRFGGIPVRSDTYKVGATAEGANRWMGAMAASASMGVQMFTIPQGVEIIPQIELRLQEVLLGRKTNAQALNALADDIAGILEKSGHKVARLAPLP